MADKPLSFEDIEVNPWWSDVAQDADRFRLAMATAIEAQLRRTALQRAVDSALYTWQKSPPEDPHYLVAVHMLGQCTLAGLWDCTQVQLGALIDAGYIRASA